MSNASDFIIEDGVLKKYVGPGGDVVIPEGVTEIGVCAFFMCHGIKKVHIPEGVTRIGNGAFYGCKNLLGVTIPGSVTDIGRESFSGCIVLAGLELPEGLERIDIRAFYDCKKLRHVTIPDSVSDLGYDAFRNCPGLADERGFVIFRDILFGYYGPGGDIVVPDGVRRICNEAFCTGGRITSLVLPDSVTELGDDIFRDCENLADERGFVILRDILYAYYGSNPIVVIPEGITKIGRSAFHENIGITSVQIPEGVTWIGRLAFYGCSNLKKVEIPEGVTVINDFVFARCRNLEEITIPCSVTAITWGAFSECISLTRVAIPEGVAEIGDRAFYHCLRLKNVVIPESVSRIGTDVFAECVHLAEITIPKSVTSIGDDVFRRCESLTRLEIPEGVTGIGNRAFAGCVHLTEIMIPKTVTSIGHDAFQNCKSLTKVVISGTVTNLSSKLFHDISDQAMIQAPGIPLSYFETAREKMMATRGFLHQPGLYQDSEIADDYKKYIIAQRKRLLPYIFQQDLVQALALYAESRKITVKNFETEYMAPAQAAKAVGCVACLMDWSGANITAEELQKKDQRELMKDPFNVADMKKLWSYEAREDGTLMLISYKGMETEVQVPERIGKTPVTRLDDGVFGTITKAGSAKPKKQIAALQAIQTVIIPDSVTSIGRKAFFECKGLKKVEIPDSVTEIGEQAFCGCENLVDENGLVRVRDVVYGYNGPGGSLIIPQGVTQIVERSFLECSTLTAVELPDSVRSLGAGAFCNCKNLKSVRLSANLTTIQGSTFSGCTSLQGVEIPQGVTEIGRWAFCDCKNLERLILPDSIITVKSKAFRKCDKLADKNGFVVVHGVLYSYCGPGGDITIPNGVTAIEDEAFYRSKKVTGVLIPDGVISIGCDSFSSCTNLKRIEIPSSVTDISGFAFGFGGKPQIYAPAGSYAEAYAKKNSIPFMAK